MITGLCWPPLLSRTVQKGTNWQWPNESPLSLSCAQLPPRSASPFRPPPPSTFPNLCCSFAVFTPHRPSRHRLLFSMPHVFLLAPLPALPTIHHDPPLTRSSVFRVICKPRPTRTIKKRGFQPEIGYQYGSAWCPMGRITVETQMLITACCPRLVHINQTQVPSATQSIVSCRTE